MPNRVVVKPGPNELISIRRTRRGAHPHYMGSCALANVKVFRDHWEADLLEEWSESRELGENALRQMTEVVYEPEFGFGTVTVHETEVDTSDQYTSPVDGSPLPAGSIFEPGEIIMFHPLAASEYRAGYWVSGTEMYVSVRHTL